jgi:mRNA interferase HicA
MGAFSIITAQTANHDVWVNPLTRRNSAVPRHREIKFGLARGICKQLQVPPPK